MEVNLIKNRNLALDGTKGIGCMFILLYHMNEIVFLGNAPQNHFTQFLLKLGHPLMSMFFMISSFTIYSIYQRRFKKKRFAFRLFYLRRILRIFPLWWLLILSFVLLESPKIEHILANMFFYFGFFLDSPGYNFTSIGWSLFVEEIFYIIFPIIYLVCRNIKITSLFIFILFLFQYRWINACEIDGSVLSMHYCYRFFIRHFVYLAVGILIAQILQNKKMRFIKKSPIWDIFFLLALGLKFFYKKNFRAKAILCYRACLLWILSCSWNYHLLFSIISIEINGIFSFHIKVLYDLCHLRFINTCSCINDF